MVPTGSRKPALGFVFVTVLLAAVGFGPLIPVLPQRVVEFRGGDIAAGAVWLGFLEGPTNWALQPVVLRHAGTAFFEGAVLTAIALLVAAKSFRAAAGVVPVREPATVD